MGWFSDRATFARDLQKQNPFGWLGAAASVLFAIFQHWREQWADTSVAEGMRLVDLLPSPPWSVAIGLGFLCLWIFEAAYRRQKPGMRLYFASSALGIELPRGPDSLVEQALFAMLANGTQNKMEECQIQLRIRSYDATPQSRENAFPVCVPFSLRPDEAKPVKLLSYQFDMKDAHLSIPTIVEQDGGWVKVEGICALLPGHHDIQLEALSAHSKSAKLLISADFVKQSWVFSCRGRTL